MHRKEKTNLSILCLHCKEYSQTIEPLSIYHGAKNRFYFKGQCYICHKMKSQVLNRKQREALPEEISTIPIGSTIVDKIEKNGEVLPLLPILGLILAGLTVAGTAAGVTTSSINDKLTRDEQSRHNSRIEDSVKSYANQDLEKAARGNGINEAIKLLQGNGFSIYL